jgi:putative flippase GtrA
LKLALLYTLFAVIATLANIGSQEVSIRAYDGTFGIPLSVFVGTGVGLVVKYVLDKRWIFGFRADNVAHDTKTFALYTVMGLATTAVFWGFEFAFHALFQSKEMRYLGGVIGLAIGYLTKYQLDKRYVFPPQTVRA